MIKILIVDDDLGFQRILGISLQKFNNLFEAILANDGEEAITILQHEDIDLLVTDIQMPKLDGLALLSWVSEHLPELPYIIMTAHSTANMDESYASIGPRFLKKPFTTNKLADVIMGVLQPAQADGDMRGISVSSFLLMIELERKSCQLEVTSNNGDKGSLYLHNGELYDAAYAELVGEDAAFEIINTDHPRIRFRESLQKMTARSINISLKNILEEALSRKNETLYE